MTQGKYASAPGKRWLKIISLAAITLAALLVVAYLVLTSGWFIKQVVLPKAGKALQAEITAEEVKVSPWSRVEMSGFKWRTGIAEPLLTVKRFTVRYPSLMDLVKGRIILDEIAVDGLQVRLVEEADGRNNWEKLVRTESAAPSGPPSSVVPEVLIKKAVLTDATVAYVRRQGTNAQTVELRGLNVSVENVANRQTATLRSEGELRWETREGSRRDAIHCAWKAEGSVALDNTLRATSSQGRFGVRVQEAVGLLADTQALGGQLDWDWTPTEIRQLSLAFSRSNQPLASLQVRGPFDPGRGEGQLQFELDRVSGQVLSLAAAAAGYAIPQGSLSARGQLQLADHANNLKAAGEVDALQLCVAQRGKTTPPTDLRLRFGVEVQQDRQWLKVNELGLSASVSNRIVAKADLAKPMQLSWGTTESQLEDSEFLLMLQGMELADWRALMPEGDIGGQVEMRAWVKSANAGQTLALDIRGGVRNLRVQWETNGWTASELQWEARTVTTQFQRTEIAHLSLRYLEGGGAVMAATATGQVDHTRQDLQLKISSEASLPALVAKAGLTNFHVKSGEVQFQGEVIQKNHAPTNSPTALLTQSIVSRWRLSGLSGRYEDYPLEQLGAEVESDLVLSNHTVFIRQIQTGVSQAGRPAGDLSVAGQVNLAQSNGVVSLQLSNVNERLFLPAAALFGSNRLESVRVDGALQAAFAPGQWSATGAVRLADFRMSDPAKTWPREPLGAEVLFDLGQRATVTEARRLQARFQMGQRDAGSLDLTGQWDAARTNAQFKARVQGLNEHALRPWLAAALAPVTLESVRMEAEAEGRFQPGAQTMLTADLRVDNLRWRDAAGQTPPEPLALALKVDAVSPQPNVLSLRSASLQLAPTARATNRVQAEGMMDLSHLSAITGRLAVVSEGVDWTPYHRLFKAMAATNATTAAPSSAPQAESPPIALPLTNFVISIQAQRLFWEELAVTNLIGNVHVDGPRVRVAPLSAGINGAPARGRAEIYLGVPGYQYDVDMQIQRLPLAPLAATFLTPSPEPWQGDLSLAMALKGTGSTGPNLRRHLSGHLGLEVTNAALRIKQLLTPPKGSSATPSQQFLRVLVGILEPLLNAVGGAVGVPNLVAQPFHTSRLDLQIGQGTIELRDFTLANPTIIVGSRGRIPMADTLTASPLDLPVEISLAVPLAQRLQIASAPPGATHVKLPDFVVVRGTLENPQTRLNTKAITGTALQRVGKEVGGEAGALLQGLGNVLGGGAKVVTNAPPPAPASPTTPKTNAPINNLIDDLFRPRPRQ